MDITFAVAALALRGRDGLERRDMRCLRIYAGDDGGFRFEDVELPASRTHIVDGVPPLLVSGPFACTGVTFVAQPQDASDWQAHVAPRKQWVIVLSGRAAITTSDGVRREIGPGDVILAEDTTGQGHVSTPLTRDLRFAMIPAASCTSSALHDASAEQARGNEGQTVLYSNGVLSPAVRFVELPQGFRTGWHHAPTRQIVVVLSGVIEVGTSDGQTQHWGVGEAFMPDDLQGKGYTTRTIGGPVRLLYRPLAQDFGLQRWL
jgi:quercetin dioxygenase-like cupin family protein